jgi:hypothetical protein
MRHALHHLVPFSSARLSLPGARAFVTSQGWNQRVNLGDVQGTAAVRSPGGPLVPVQAAYWLRPGQNQSGN